MKAINVTVIGSGSMAAGLVKQLTRAGHRVLVTGRNAAKAQALAHAHGARALKPVDAAASDVIIVATGYADAVGALRSLGDLHGKVVIDITNPLTADYMGLTLGHTTSAAEEIAAAVPEAKVVKAFNTVFAQVLDQGASLGDDPVPVFVAGDDSQAKSEAAGLARSMGFDVIDAGPLRNARYLEPLAGLNIYLGYGAKLGTSIAPAWLRKEPKAPERAAA